MYRILDTETASLQGGVVEIAWVDIDEDLNVQHTFGSFVNPERSIEPAASSIHGIFDVDVATKPILSEFKPQWGAEPAKVIGHNVAFDIRMLNRTFPVDGTLCTLSLARKLVPNSENHRLQTLRQLFNIPENTAHSASGDIQTTLEVLRNLVTLSGVPLSTLWERAQVPKMVMRMPFGKYKGVAMLKVPPVYRNWLKQQDNLDKNLKFTLDKLENT
jgi:exodeoxyribonuclease X